MKNSIIALCLFLFAQPVLGDGHKFKSSVYHTNLVELFSSEGCSSCPPADRWLSTLRHSPELWKTFVPLEFHVDYWNHLGWIDKNAKASFTQRQRDYARSWGTNSVYTPGFVLNGEEWRPSIDSALRKSQKPVGELEATQLTGDHYRVVFHDQGNHTRLVLHAAALGNGLVTKVAAGENKGETLIHDFVVLALNQSTLKKVATAFTADIEIKPSIEGVAPERSVAFWITDDQGSPIQAVGGDLN